MPVPETGPRFMKMAPAFVDQHVQGLVPALWNSSAGPAESAPWEPRSQQQRLDPIVDPPSAGSPRGRLLRLARIPARAARPGGPFCASIAAAVTLPIPDVAPRDQRYPVSIGPAHPIFAATGATSRLPSGRAPVHLPAWRSFSAMASPLVGGPFLPFATPILDLHPAVLEGRATSGESASRPPLLLLLEQLVDSSRGRWQQQACGSAFGSGFRSGPAALLRRDLRIEQETASPMLPERAYASERLSGPLAQALHLGAGQPARWPASTPRLHVGKSKKARRFLPRFHL